METLNTYNIKSYLKRVCDERFSVFKELQKIPEDCVTDEIIRLALSRHIRVLEVLPQKKLTEKICLFAVAQHHEFAAPVYTPLQFVPKEKRTYKVCLEAVRHFAANLSFVPKEFLTPELYTLALMQDGLAYRQLPERFQTEEVLPLALLTRGSMLQYLAPEKRTQYLCMLALSCTPQTDLSLKDNLQDAILRERQAACEYIPEGMPSHADVPGYREKKMLAMQAFCAMSRVEPGFVQSIDEHLHFFGASLQYPPSVYSNAVFEENNDESVCSTQPCTLNSNDALDSVEIVVEEVEEDTEEEEEEESQTVEPEPELDEAENDSKHECDDRWPEPPIDLESKETVDTSNNDLVF